MARKLTTGVLIAAGLWLIASGAQRWLDRRAARQVVHAFLEDVTNGDRRAAQSLMASEARLPEERRRSAPVRSPPVSREIAYRVRSLDVDGDRAAADVSVEKDGLGLRFTIELRRIAAGDWKVARIGAPRVHADRLLETEQAERQRAAGQQLTRELREALRDHPGVSVERVSLETPAE